MLSQPALDVLFAYPGVNHRQLDIFLRSAAEEAEIAEIQNR